MENGGHDRFVWDLGVVGVRGVDRIGLALTHVNGERFFSVRDTWIVGFAVVLNKILDERVRAGGIVWRIGKPQDGLVFTNGKTLDLTEFGIFEFFTKFLQEVSAPGFVVLEDETEAFDLPCFLNSLFYRLLEEFQLP